MKKNILIMSLFCILRSINGFAVVPVTNELEEAREKTSFIASKNSLNKLLDNVKNAKGISSEVQALRQLSDFSNKSATDISSAVTDMLNQFNSKMGTSFTSLPDLISGMLSATDTKTMMLQLQQAANSQLNDISTSLKQMEAENQAMIKFKQADIAEKARQDKKFRDDLKAQGDAIDRANKGLDY